MILISQNLSNYEIPIPENSVYRINLAWVNDIKELVTLVEKHKEHSIFVDLPINRTKPPNNKYTLNDIITILEKFEFFLLVLLYTPLSVPKNNSWFLFSTIEETDTLKVSPSSLKFLNRIPLYKETPLEVPIHIFCFESWKIADAKLFINPSPVVKTLNSAPSNFEIPPPCVANHKLPLWSSAISNTWDCGNPSTIEKDFNLKSCPNTITDTNNNTIKEESFMPLI